MKQNKGLYLKFSNTINSLSMLDGELGVLLGYSGGADSSALLHLLKKLCCERGIYLHAVHINHGIRGAEAERDAEACKRECERLSVDFTLICADIPSMAAESHRGVEETARDFRYRAFCEKISQDKRLTCIATAHNADDNAETVLFNLTRGSGIAGLCGIPSVREEQGIKVIRPLITASKAEILGYCEENCIQYVFDSTNNDRAYTRNYIRHEIMPRLLKINPSFRYAVCRMSENLTSDSDYLERAAHDFVSLNAKDGKISLSVLGEAHEAIASRAVVKMFSSVCGGMLENVHISDILSLASRGREGSRLSLPEKMCAVIERGKLFFTKDEPYKPATFNYELKYGANRFEHPDFAVFIIKADDFDAGLQKGKETLENIYKLSIHTRVNSAKISNMLYARSRCDGDSYRFDGMTRKLKKLYNDRGYSARVREALPVIADDEGIIWVPGFKSSDRVRDDNEDLIIIYYYNSGEDNE